MIPVRQCNKCERIKAITHYSKITLPNGKIYFRRVCTQCRSKENVMRMSNGANDREQANKYMREFRKTHPDYAEYMKKYLREWHREKRETDVKYKLNRNMGGSMYKALRRNKSGNKWEILVGYNIDDLRNHLENLFDKNMTWGKLLNGEIHIDHIIPKSLWKYDRPEDNEFKQCWALANLQPLWAKDNFIKNNKMKRVL